MTKTLSLPFFGAGLVDLPPGAVKHLKDPGVMQLVFFVASGRVTVSVNGTMFGIGKGGIFEVPRGKGSLSFQFLLTIFCYRQRTSLTGSTQAMSTGSKTRGISRRGCSSRRAAISRRRRGRT